jgi:hypothetical protein
MVERRNQDFYDICKRMVFPLPPWQDYRTYTLSNPCVAGIRDTQYQGAAQYQSGEAVLKPHFAYGGSRFTTSMFDSDHLIWMGFYSNARRSQL